MEALPDCRFILFPGMMPVCVNPPATPRITRFKV